MTHAKKLLSLLLVLALVLSFAPMALAAEGDQDPAEALAEQLGGDVDVVQNPDGSFTVTGKDAEAEPAEDAEPAEAEEEAAEPDEDSEPAELELDEAPLLEAADPSSSCYVAKLTLGGDESYYYSIADAVAAWLATENTDATITLAGESAMAATTNIRGATSQYIDGFMMLEASGDALTSETAYVPTPTDHVLAVQETATIEIPAGRNLTFDMNGGNLYNTLNPLFRVFGSLTVNGAGANAHNASGSLVRAYNGGGVAVNGLSYYTTEHFCWAYNTSLEYTDVVLWSAHTNMASRVYFGGSIAYNDCWMNRTEISVYGNATENELVTGYSNLVTITIDGGYYFDNNQVAYSTADGIDAEITLKSGYFGMNQIMGGTWTDRNVTLTLGDGANAPTFRAAGTDGEDDTGTIVSAINTNLEFAGSGMLNIPTLRLSQGCSVTNNNTGSVIVGKVEVDANGTLDAGSLAGVTIDDDDPETVDGIYLTANGATVTGSTSLPIVATLGNNKNNIATLADGTMTGTVTVAGGTLNITSAAVSSLTAEAGQTNVMGGTVGTLNVTNGRVAVTDGTVTTLNVTGGTVTEISGRGAVGAMTISGGTLYGDVAEWNVTTLRITGGYFPDMKDSELTALGSLGVIDLGTSTVSGHYVYTGEAPSVADVGSTHYLSLQDAVNAATDGQTVTLTADTTENVVVPAGKSLTIDFKGHTLTASGAGKQSALASTNNYASGNYKVDWNTDTFYDALSVYGTVTLLDSSDSPLAENKYHIVTTQHVWYDTPVVVYPGGNVTVGGSGQTLKMQTAGRGFAVGGTLVINDLIAETNGSLIRTCYGQGMDVPVIAPLVEATKIAAPSVTINGGTYTDAGADSTVVVNYGAATINNGTFTNTNTGGHAVLLADGVSTAPETYTPSSTITVNGGTFTKDNGNGYSALSRYAGSRVTLNGGTFNGRVRAEQATVTVGATEGVNANDSAVTVNANGNAYALEATNNAASVLTVHHGTFYGDNEAYRVYDGSGNVTTRAGIVLSKDTNSVVAIDGGQFLSGYDAEDYPDVYVINGNRNDTWTGGYFDRLLLTEAYTTTFNGSSAGVVDLNRASSGFVLTDGTVTTLNLTLGTATLNGGTVTTANVSGGTVTVSGGSIGTLNVSGGTVKGDLSAATVTTLKLTGGTYPDTEPSWLESNKAAGCTVTDHTITRSGSAELFEGAVARTVSGGATTYCDSLQAAVYAATADGATVTLLADVTENVIVPKVEDVAITIDFNGHTLTTSAEGKYMSIYKPNARVASAFAVYGDATIVNTGENGRNYNIENSAGGSAIYVFPGGKLTVGREGGTDGVEIRSSKYSVFYLQGGEVVVHSAEVETNVAADGSVFQIPNTTSSFAGTDTEDGTDVWTTYAADSRITINGGTFTHKAASNQLGQAYYGKVTINGGTFIKTSEANKNRMFGTYGRSAEDRAEMLITGGVFDAPASAILYTDQYSAVTVTGGTFYGYVQAISNSTLTLGDPEDSSKGPTVYDVCSDDSGSAVRLSSAGATLTINGGTYYGGHWDKSSGAVVYDGHDAALSKTVVGTLNVSGGTFYGGTHSALSDDAKDVTLNGGVFDRIETSAARTLTIDGATVTNLSVSGQSTISLESGSVGTLTVTGGTVTTNLDGMSAAVGEYQVTGGVFSATAPDYMNNTPGVLAAGYVATALGEGSTVGAANAASVSIGGGAETYYNSLQAAIDAAGASAATVRLYADVTENVVVAAGQTITIDFNGCTLTNSTEGKNSSTYVPDTTYYDALSVYGDVTLINSATEGNEYNLVNVGLNHLTITYPGGTLTVGGGDAAGVVSFRNTTGYCFTIAGGTVTIEDANVSVTKGTDGSMFIIPETGGMIGSSWENNLDKNSTLNINGGTFTFTASSNVMLYQYVGTVNITGGTFTKTHASNTNRMIGTYARSNSNYATLNISGGTFETANYSAIIYVSNNYRADVNITGGTFLGSIQSLKYSRITLGDGSGHGPTVYGTVILSNKNAQLTIHDGVYYGGQLNEDGTVTYDRSPLQKTIAGTWTVDGGTFYGGGEYSAVSCTVATTLAGGSYDCIMVPQTGALTLGAGVTVNDLQMTDGTLTLSDAVKVKDGTVSGGAITGGTLNATGSLEIAEGASIASAVSFASGSTATVSGGTITGATTFASGSTATVSGGTLGAVTLKSGSGGVISGGTFDGALAAEAGTNTRIIGGTFTGTLPASFTGTGFISGGTFDNEPIAALIETGYRASDSSPYTIVSLGLARVGNKYVATKADLLNNYLTLENSAGKTVKLLQATTIADPADYVDPNAAAYTTPKGAYLNASGYLDLNGQTLTVADGGIFVAFGEIIDTKGGGSIRVADGATVYLPDSLKYTRSTPETYKSETAQRSNTSAVALKGSVTVEGVTYTEYKVYDFSMRTHEPRADLNDERGYAKFGFRPDFEMSAAFTQLSGGWSAAGLKVGVVLSSDGLLADQYFYFSEDNLKEFAGVAATNVNRVLTLELSNLRALKGNALTATPFVEVNGKIVRFQPMSYTYALPIA